MQQLVVILSTANFRFRPWTNKQWMASEYLKSRIPVVYIEPHGLRLPKCNYSDLKRIFSNLYSNRISRSAHACASRGRFFLLSIFARVRIVGFEYKEEWLLLR